MGIVKEGRLPCPFDGCESSDAYHIFDDDTSYCFSCQRGDYKRQKPSDLEKGYGDFRGVSAATQERLGFLNYYDKEGNVLFREYKYPNGNSKFRDVVPKRFWVTGSGRLPKIAGPHIWNAGSSKTVVVVEGEEDAGSAMELLDLPVYWLTSASIGVNREEIYNALKPFSKIVLAFESDPAGENAKSIIGNMLPGQVFEASLTKYKDANEYLINGAGKEFFWAVLNAKKFTADFVYNTDADFDKIIFDESTSVVVPTPFQSLNNLIKGLPLGRIVLLTGMEGLGKTEILRAMEYKVLKDHPEYSISITHHEESKRDVLTGLACYELQKNCRDPDNPVPNEEISGAIRTINSNGKLHLTEIGTDASTVAEVMERFNYLATVCGVQYFFVDPINQFTPPDDGATNLVSFLDGLSKAMAKFVVERNVCCVWTAHVNDDGQTRDSRMISKMAGIRIDIGRDPMAEDEEVRNRTHLYVPKNRPFSKTGGAGTVVFDMDTFTIQSQGEVPF